MLAPEDSLPSVLPVPPWGDKARKRPRQRLGQTVNALSPRTSRANRYVGLRHGESVANQQGIILSNPRDGVTHYGLTLRGRQQVEESLASATCLDARARIYTSDFRRARETAEIAHAWLHCVHPLIASTALRERFFGDWEGTSNCHYADVWAADAGDPRHTQHGVESAQAVRDRLLRLVMELERQWQGETILLVSHGDPLQILQTAFLGQSPAMHRSLPPLHTAEIRVFP